MAPMHNKDLKVEHMLEVVLGNNCHRQVDHKVEAVLDDFLKLRGWKEDEKTLVWVYNQRSPKQPYAKPFM